MAQKHLEQKKIDKKRDEVDKIEERNETEEK